MISEHFIHVINEQTDKLKGKKLICSEEKTSDRCGPGPCVWCVADQVTTEVVTMTGHRFPLSACVLCNGRNEMS